MAAIKGTAVNLQIEFNTSGQPTGNLFMDGRKYTYTFSFAMQGYGMQNAPIAASTLQVSFNGFTTDRSSVDVILPNGSVQTLTLTIAAGQ